MFKMPVNDYPWEGPFPTTPNWSENFLLAGDDPNSGVGFWCHIGRWRHDLSMFRETILVRLPDGTVATGRAMGDARSAKDGPGGPHYAIRIIEPGRKLTYSYSGGVRRVPAQSMRDGLVGDGPRTPMRFQLTYETTADVWDLHKVGLLQEFLPAGHIEQLGRVTGFITVGSDRWNIDTVAVRDHSLGPRDNKDLLNHQWHQGIFDNGIKFMLYDAMSRKTNMVSFTEAAVYEGDKLYDAKLEMGWRCDDAMLDEKPFSFRIHYENGTLDIDVVKVTSNSYASMFSPNDLLVGVYPICGEKTLVLLEQSCIYKLNGSIHGYGALERTVIGTIQPEMV